MTRTRRSAYPKWLTYTEDGADAWRAIIPIVVLCCCCLQLLKGAERYPSSTEPAPGAYAGRSVLGTAVAGPTSSSRVFVGVISKSNNSALRQAIRDTWGGDERLAAVMFFVLRPHSNATFRALREEGFMCNDVFVVSSEYEDSPSSITLATLEMLNMASVVPGITHVLKVDDNSFMRVNRLHEVLQELPSERLYGGSAFISEQAVSPQDHGRYWPAHLGHPDEERLPYYASGPSILLTIDLVRRISAGAAHAVTPPDNLPLQETVAVGLWIDFIRQEVAGGLEYVPLPFDSAVCHPDDPLSHLDLAHWPSPVEGQRCLFSDTCKDRCAPTDDLSVRRHLPGSRGKRNGSATMTERRHDRHRRVVHDISMLV
eukprot:gene10044-10200_t